MPDQAAFSALPVSLRSLVESLPFPVFVLERDGRLIFCNSLSRDFFGRPPEGMVGQTLADLMADEAAAGCAAQCAAVWADGQPRRHSLAIRRGDGQMRQVLCRHSRLLDDQGVALGLICVMEDVTEERHAMRALTAREARFARMAQLTDQGVVLHAYGEIVDVNEALVRMVGIPRENLLGQHYSVLLGPEAVEQARAQVEGRSNVPYRTEMRRADGTILAVEVQGHGLILDDQEVRVATVTDITERLAAEEAMRERELLYRQMFENNRVVKLLIDPGNGQVVDANPAAAQFYGWSIDQLRVMNISQINALPMAEIKAEMEQARTEARTFFRFRHRTARDGIRQVEVFSGPCQFHGRALLHSIIIDVTERERALAELQRKSEALELSNADLQQFAYVASHDLQEPLRSVVSYLQLLERRYMGNLDAEADEFIGFAVNGAKRMGALIQDLLLYSRVDAQGSPLEPVDCDAVMTSALANLRYLLDSQLATVEVAGPLPCVLGDAPQLSSVLQNLIGNAVKYRDRDRTPHIRINAEATGAGEWLFTVADNGIGIAPEYHDRIFNIFQRLHSQGEYPGTGIGLALVRRIISRHGGRVWVESPAAGQPGAVFRFTLPMIAPPREG